MEGVDHGVAAAARNLGRGPRHARRYPDRGRVEQGATHDAKIQRRAVGQERGSEAAPRSRCGKKCQRE